MQIIFTSAVGHDVPMNVLEDGIIFFVCCFFVFVFLIEIHSMQGSTATTRHKVTRERITKRLKMKEICLERTSR